MGKTLKFEPPGRGFFIFLDYQDHDGDPVVFFREVGLEDAFAAAAAILRPILQHQPDLACMTVGALVHKAEAHVCDMCPGDGTCLLTDEPPGEEQH